MEPISMELKYPGIKFKSAQGRYYVRVTAKGEHEDNLTRLRKEHYQTISAEPLYNFACNSATEKRKYEATTSRGNGSIEGEGEYSVAVQYAPIPLHLAVGISSFNPITAVVSNSQGELEDNLTRLKRERYQTISAEPLYNFACNSATEKRKYEATTSRGNGRIEGEGEYSVAVQYAYAIGSVVKEPLKDVDLLFSLSSQPPYFALSQRAEEREHNLPLPQRAEEREHNFALSQRAEGTENKSWVEGLGSKVSHVIYIGMRAAAPCIGLYLLNKNSGKKFYDLALQLKTVNEALGAAGCPIPTVCVLNPSITISSLFALFNFGNPRITVSPPSGLFNRGNPSTTVSPFLGLININIGNRGNSVEESGNK